MDEMALRSRGKREQRNSRGGADEAEYCLGVHAAYGQAPVQTKSGFCFLRLPASKTSVFLKPQRVPASHNPFTFLLPAQSPLGSSLVENAFPC
jgi:hypothetical protein